MKLLGKYKNGNYTVTVFDDGTKVRRTEDDEFIPEKPESMDIKITNKCDKGCAFCHEDSKVDGLHGELLSEEMMQFLDSLLPYTELAIGGGNPLEHPQLEEFLMECRDRKIICNMTVNQVHFHKSLTRIKLLMESKLIYGLGVSLVYFNTELVRELKSMPNAVIHLINGVHSLEDIRKLYDNDLKILILGYKDFRRGIAFHNEAVDIVKSEIYDELPEMLKRFKVVSFDNLALKQLECKRLLNKEEWEEFYMGDDGSYTMYIDLVNRKFTSSSISTTRYDFIPDIKQMFQTIKDNK